jgi:signal transduction histidine kinase
VVVRDANQRVTHYNGYIIDITERKRIEDERAQLQVREQAARAEVAAAQDLAQLKSAFINAVSHDLRNPLTAIKGYAEFFEDEMGGPVTDEQRDYIAQILKGTKRLEFLVNDLLDAARSEAGTFSLHLEQADFRAKVQEVIKGLGPQAHEAGLSLEAEFSPEALSLIMDPERIERVLDNLLANAIKFTPAGGRIRVRAGLEGDWLRCEVEDSGVAIAPEDLSKLFKPFSQLEAGKKEKGGTGLGLSISKTIVEEHGGSIGVCSEVGKGSTFWFTLPLHRPSPGA